MEQMNMCEETTLSNAFSQSETSVAELQSVVSTLEYEVFLSFRGPDVRKSFADFLYSYLVRSKIRTFRDEEELRKGETIAPSLIQAITESKIYIPILSKSYASSKWCLQELAKMVECCREGNGHIILPVFYFMDPRDVRHQAGPYEEAFEQHSKKHDPIIVQKWRTALQEVGQMKGWHVTEIDGQGAVIDQIFSKVQLHLRSDYTLVTEELIGIDCHVQEVTRLLNLDSGDGKVVGIHGIGGMGKTTIAKAVYDNICTSFNRCCFLENIRELLLKNDGVMALQNKIISRILRDDIQVKDASEGVNIIRERVCKYKVLIVLDDVDDKFEFVQILGKLGNFSSESRFIITTRDKRVLELIQEYKLYEPKEMSSDHSLQLFSMHAFAVHCPPEGYATLCEEFVKVAARLPLALKVIGSLLFCRDKQFWEEKLIELKEVRATSNMVQQRLKISYNELTRTEKIIFLDIACFFIGEDKELPFIMWSDCNLYPESGIRTLVLRSLIKVDERNQFWMHDHLRDLGRGIVIEEDVKHPFKRSRIWSNEDAMNMLENVEAADRVEMLKVSMTWSVHTDNKYFQKLSSLRYLVLEVTPLFGDFSEVLPDMRWLKLSNCFFIPTDLNMKNVVILEIQGCVLTDDWGGWNRVKVAHKLKVINVRGCRGLNRIPDFSQCTRLESIDLTGCLGLKGELNISNFRNLKVVRLQETDITLSGDMGKLQKLQEIKTGKLGWGAEEVPVLPTTLKRLAISSPRVPNLLELKDLEELWFENCNDPPEIPGDIWKLQKLKTLKTVKCSCEGSLLSNQDGTLPSSLTCLIVDWSRGLTRLPNLANSLKISYNDLTRNEKIIFLDIACFFIGEDKELPFYMWGDCNLYPESGIRTLVLRSLIKVDERNQFWMHDHIRDLGRSIVIEEDVEHPYKRSRVWSNEDAKNMIINVEVAFKLKVINLRGCSKLNRIPDFSQCSSLESVDLTDCLGLKGELNISNFRNLKVVRLQETDITLAGDMRKLQKLQEIKTGKLGWGAEEVPVLPTSLKRLAISSPRVPNLLELKDLEELSFENCDEAPEIPGDIWQLQKLKTLKMVNCNCEGSLLSNQDGALPSSLTCLIIDWSRGLTRLPNLANLSNLMELRLIQFRASEIHGLGKLRVLEALEISESMSLDHLHGLENLVHLKELTLKSCGLQALPNLSNLIKLHKLVIVKCPLLYKIQDLGELKLSLLHLEVSCCDLLADLDGLESMEALESLTLESTTLQYLNPHKPFPDLSRQNLKQLCIAGWKQLPEVIELGRLRSLRSLEMKACMSLRRLPNLSDLDNLETLDVSGCIRLVDVTGLEKLESLQKLNMSNCWSIEELPDISGMKSLDDLNVSECIKLKKVIGLEKLESLTVLSMAGCKSIKKLPDMSQLKVLFEIDLKGCTKLKKVTGLTKLPFLIKVSMDTRLEVQHYLKSLVREGINAVRERM
ncbi:Disease resistance protein L6 [Linum perenne]